MREKKNVPVILFACASLLALSGALCHPVHAQSSVPIIGIIPLVAFNISVSGIHDTGATINWTTNGDANSRVEYGPTTSYGSVRTDPAMVTSHSLILDGLTPGTLYHYRVVSEDPFGNRYTGRDLQFTTTGTPPGPGGGGTGGWTGGGGMVYRIQPGLCNATPNGVSTPVTGTGILSCCIITFSANGMTDLRASWSVNILESPPAGARFVTFILSQPSDTTRSAFDAALASQGLQMTALAYVMEVTESRPIVTGVETIQMDVDRSWVSQNGGAEAVRIISLGEDGLVHILETRFSHSVLDTGHMNFRAVSHDDLSLYALIAVKVSPVTVLTTPTTSATTVVPTGMVTEATRFPIPVPTGLLAMIVILAIIIIVIGLINPMRKKGK